MKKVKIFAALLIVVLSSAGELGATSAYEKAIRYSRQP